MRIGVSYNIIQGSGSRLIFFIYFRIIEKNMNFTFENIINKNTTSMELEKEASVEPSSTQSVFHHLHFLILSFSLIGLFVLSMVIFVMNLFKTSFYTSSRSAHNRYIPNINIIEATRSASARAELQKQETNESML